jgi:hypothetical protein
LKPLRPHCGSASRAATACAQASRCEQIAIAAGRLEIGPLNMAHQSLPGCNHAELPRNRNLDKPAYSQVPVRCTSNSCTVGTVIQATDALQFESCQSSVPEESGSSLRALIQQMWKRTELQLLQYQLPAYKERPLHRSDVQS